MNQAFEQKGDRPMSIRLAIGLFVQLPLLAMFLVAMSLGYERTSQVFFLALTVPLLLELQVRICVFMLKLYCRTFLMMFAGVGWGGRKAS